MLLRIYWAWNLAAPRFEALEPPTSRLVLRNALAVRSTTLRYLYVKLAVELPLVPVK
jgi:hypothetical protein